VGARSHAGLRALPAVHELASALEGPVALRTAAARRAIDERRAEVLAQPHGCGHHGADGDAELVSRARAVLAELERATLRRVLNATGVIVHTNLGRAPLAKTAREAVARAAEGYSDLEFDLRTGERGSRQVHVSGLLRELTGATDAIVVNNGAGAVLLATAALAGPGRAVVVSRGQLVEIGGGFRIPEVISQSGSELIEVGTTNRTELRDYERALAAAALPVGAILRVHKSNFRTLGFVADVAVRELCGLGVPVIDDTGSGVIAPEAALLGDEPAVRSSVAAGAALVCCSADKLLGGPQAGLIVGRAEAVAAARAHPLARALRIDKLSLAALEATLQLYRDPVRARAEIPVLAMLGAGEDELAARARAMRDAIGAQAEIVEALARVGGGALPLVELRGPAVALAAEDVDALAARLRAGEPPVVARIHDGRLLLDPRTLTDEEAQLVGGAVRAALRPPSRG
jgi:L-seryl-tRNA(Ser) seleniumtransferase